MSAYKKKKPKNFNRLYAIAFKHCVKIGDYANLVFRDLFLANDVSICGCIAY